MEEEKQLENEDSKVQSFKDSNLLNLRWTVGICTLTRIVGDFEAVVS